MARDRKTSARDQAARVFNIKNAPTITTTVSTGNRSETKEALGGPTETMLPKLCVPVTVRELLPRTHQADNS